MRILWHSNGMRVRTGYGKETGLVCRRLSRAGHEVFVSASYGVKGGPVEVDGVVHLPGALNVADQGQIALPLHVQQLEPDVVVTLLDVWPLPETLGQIVRGLGSRWVPWVPIDHQPVPRKVRSRLVHAHSVVAMSRYGQNELARAGIDAAYIPHGVDRSVFGPGAKAAARATLGLPEEGFGIVMVQANKGYPSRKCFQQQLDGFARFRRNHPDSWLYLHAWGGSELGGPDLVALCDDLGIRDAVIGMDPYLGLVGMPDATVAQVYRAADVTLNATGGEGFGIPIVESLACGTPVIVTDFSAMTELCLEQVGWRIGFTDRFYTGLDAYQVWPDPAQIERALQAAFVADRSAMAPHCVTFAEQFDADSVASQWMHLLDEITEQTREPANGPTRWVTLEPRSPEAAITRTPEGARPPKRAEGEPGEREQSLGGRASRPPPQAEGERTIVQSRVPAPHPEIAPSDEPSPPEARDQQLEAGEGPPQ